MSEPVQDAGRPLIRVEGPRDGVALLTLDRPEVLNALSFALLAELDAALRSLDADMTCRALVITGAGERAFAAGVDIKQLADQTSAALLAADPFGVVDRIGGLRLPVIAAVRGFALGGGCELALACDLVVLGDDAQLGLPELGLGVIPGAGGTQRLTRTIGRARAMEMVLTGRRIKADEADRLGLATIVVPAADTLDRALDLAATVATQAPLAVAAAKASVNAAQETSLADGIRMERVRFADLFGTQDQREGMNAFLEKRKPTWSGR